jgi:hypothetical protein
MRQSDETVTQPHATVSAERMGWGGEAGRFGRWCECRGRGVDAEAERRRLAREEAAAVRV